MGDAVPTEEQLLTIVVSLAAHVRCLALLLEPKYSEVRDSSKRLADAAMESVAHGESKEL